MRRIKYGFQSKIYLRGARSTGETRRSSSLLFGDKNKKSRPEVIRIKASETTVRITAVQCGSHPADHKPH